MGAAGVTLSKSGSGISVASRSPCEAREHEGDGALGRALVRQAIGARDRADAAVLRGQLLAVGDLPRRGGEALERFLHLARGLAALDDRRAGGLAEAGVLGVHRGQRGQARLAGRGGDPGARHAVAPAGEGRPGDDHLGAALLGLADQLGGEVGMRGRVVVAADGGGDDLVLVADEARQLAPGTRGAVSELRARAGRVLAAHAGEELVDVVDDLHGAIGLFRAGEPAPAEGALRAVDGGDGELDLVRGGLIEQGDLLAAEGALCRREGHALIVVSGADHGGGLRRRNHERRPGPVAPRHLGEDADRRDPLLLEAIHLQRDVGVGVAAALLRRDRGVEVQLLAQPRGVRGDELLVGLVDGLGAEDERRQLELVGAGAQRGDHRVRLVQDRRVLQRGVAVLAADHGAVVELGRQDHRRQAAREGAPVDEDVLELALRLEVEDDADARLAV